MMLDANGNPVYYLSDGIGSVIGLANGAGMELGDFRYDSFGNVREEWGGAIGSAGGDFRFQGQWLENSTGIYHFRARDYDAQTGTFLSRDPIDPNEQQPEAMNPYQFGYNNPHLYSDPTGMFTITELNSSQAINNILQNAQRLALQQARESLIDTARGVASDVIKSALKKLTPFDSVTGILDGNFLSGNGFASLLKDSVCELIPAPEGIKNRAWFEVDVEPRGNPQTNGFNCGETIPSPEEFTSRYGTYSLLDVTKIQELISSLRGESLLLMIGIHQPI